MNKIYYAIVYVKRGILRKTETTVKGELIVSDLGLPMLSGAAILVIAENLPAGHEFKRITFQNSNGDILYEREG